MTGMTPALRFVDVSFSYAAPQGAGAGAGRGTRAGAGTGVVVSPTLSHVSLELSQGSFGLLVGPTGSGKSTLLRLAKPQIAPAGRLDGRIEVCGRDVGGLRPRDSAADVGFVFQDPDAQIVCDSVWHELAFGLENLGVPEGRMRRRVAETCIFLGLEPLFGARTAELSGGQRQVVALAAALALRPRVLLLDEPTSMLDSVAEKAFLGLLFRVSRELGVAVLVATHAPERMADYADRAFVLERGRVRAASVREVARAAEGGAGVPGGSASVDAGADTDAIFSTSSGADADVSPSSGAVVSASNGVTVSPSPSGAGAVLCASDLWFRYTKDAPWVLCSLDLELARGEVRALVGANASGKTTLLRLLAGVERPQRGRVRNAAAAAQAFLPQNPKELVSRETVEDELMAWSASSGAYGQAQVRAVLRALGLEGCPERHPYDLSGGELELLALEKLLLLRPRLLLLDEPTKGLDARFRSRLAARVLEARAGGATVIVATHDLAFVRSVATSVSLLFDGGVAATEAAGAFFEDTMLA